jgi:hypothetical protein
MEALHQGEKLPVLYHPSDQWATQLPVHHKPRTKLISIPSSSRAYNTVWKEQIAEAKE